MLIKNSESLFKQKQCTWTPSKILVEEIPKKSGVFSLNEVMLKMKNIRSSAGSVVEVEILE